MDVAAAAAALGIAWPCSRGEVTRAFRAAALRAHPDQGGNDEAIRRVVAARTTLERAMGVKT
jgi:curved DNA-binding protein CbpA